MAYFEFSTGMRMVSAHSNSSGWSGCGRRTLVTGVKRDIGLLTRILENPDYEVTVLDISLGQESGRPLISITISQGLPWAPRARCPHRDPPPQRGTSLLMWWFPRGEMPGLAVVGTFSDNFEAVVRRAVASWGWAKRS